jgi:hypothetical protein
VATIPLAAFAIVTGVGECVVAELADTEGGVPDRVCLIVPGEIAWDTCDCGQFAQTIVSVGPTDQFPTPSTGDIIAPCASKLLVASVTLSLTRCVPGIQRNNEPPTCAQLLEAARILEDDRSAVRRAVFCCLKEFLRAYRIFNMTLGTGVSVGPQGGCAGVELTYQFSIPSDCCV